MKIAVVALVAALFSCAGRRPEGLGVHEGRLAPCPGSPNCVSSDAAAAPHRVEPLWLAADAGEAWRAVRAVVGALPRVSIAREHEGYLHAECRSALWGFVDDLELHLRPEADHIAVRSASRLGYSDLGVNRRRVEAIRSRLRERGVVAEHAPRDAEGGGTR